VVKEVAFVVPGDLSTPTGGYTYDRRILAGLGALGWRTQVLDIGEGFPRPTPAVRAAARGRLAKLSPAGPVVIDGLAYGVLADEAKALAQTHRIVALVHHPLALETGLREGEAAALRASERAALSHARQVVVTSPSTARLLVADFAVPPDRVSVVQPGTDRIARKPRSPGAEVELLAVGSIVPRKGYDVLMTALASLPDLAWRLTVAGDLSRSPQTAQALNAAIVQGGLAGRITFTGAVAPERLQQYYAAADLFVLPSRFEGYGMAFAEAIAHGLPVVATTAGAIPETVPPGAGVLVPPDDPKALAAALRRLIADASARDRLATGARVAATAFPSWPEQAAAFAQVLERLP
jgi:glycosyltransferase involved in cell wall biosynthesis